VSVEPEMRSVIRKHGGNGPACVCPVCGCDCFREFLQAPDRFHGRRKPYQLERCSSCSVVRLKDPPRPSAMVEHYGSRYDEAISGPGDNPNHWLARREALLSFRSSGVLLDLGCSSGGFLSCMKGPAWQLFGIEMSESVAKRAREKSGAEVFVGDILDAPFPAGSFDAITCFHVFEHLYQPREVLSKIASWLKPGGVFYTMMPNIDSAGARIFRSYWYGLELPRHLYHFSPDSLSGLAKVAGLDPIALTTNREMFIEHSTRYVFDDVCRVIGLPRIPLAEVSSPGIAWRVIRKACRLSMLPVLTGIAALAGDGESIHAVFGKRPVGIGEIAGKGRLSKAIRFC
jgi:SAM-dependent methyltransferase